MNARTILFLVVLLPVIAWAQAPASRSIGEPASKPPNAPTLAVLLANRPAHIAHEQWLHMMEQPANRSLYPLRITQAMLDTLDATQLDGRFQYVMVREEPGPATGFVH